MILLALSLIITYGDTVRLNGEKVRMSGIDAPELRHCPPQRRCAAGDPLASKLALEQALAGKKLGIVRFKRDRYGRTIAIIYANGRNTSCAMLAGGYATYRRDWDERGRVKRDCPWLAR